MASEPLRQHRRDLDRWLPSSRQPTKGAVAEEMRQRTLFEDGDERRGRLMAAIDAIEDRHGRWTTRIAKVPVVAAE